MRMQLILAVTSPTAFLKVGKNPSVELAFNRLKSVAPSLPIVIAVDQKQSGALSGLLLDPDFNVEILICEPGDPRSFAEALLPSFSDFDALVIHDASRPMTSDAQFEDVLVAFTDEIDAVRPVMAFTETLKILNADSVIQKTLDRTSVHRISTPELIRVSAIDFTGPDCGWFLPLKEDARILYVEGSPDGLRINTVEDRDLMQLSVD